MFTGQQPRGGAMGGMFDREKNKNADASGSANASRARLDPEEGPEMLPEGINLAREVVTQLEECVIEAIMQLNFETAEFVAELLFAHCAHSEDFERGSEDSASSAGSTVPSTDYSDDGLSCTGVRANAIYYYTLALFLNNKLDLALELSKRYRDMHLGICYLFARCAIRLNRSINQAAASLSKLMDKTPNSGSHQSSTNTGSTQSLFPIDNDFSPTFTSCKSGLGNSMAGKGSDLGTKFNDLPFFPDNATLHGLLGKLYQKLDMAEESSAHFSDSLSLNPYLWESYTALCDMRATVDLKHLYYVVAKNLARHKKADSLKLNKHNFNPNLNGIPSDSGYYSRGNIGTIRKHNHKNLMFNDRNNLKDSNNGKLSFRNNGPIFQHNMEHQVDGMDNSSKGSGNSRRGTHSPLLSNANNSSTIKQQTLSTLAKIQRKTKSKSLATPPPKTQHFTDRNNDNSHRVAFRTPRGSVGNQDNGMEVHNTKNQMEIHHTELQDPYSIHKSVGKRPNNKSLFALHSSNNEPSITLPDIFFVFSNIKKASISFDSYKAIRILENHVPRHIRVHMPWCQALLGRLHYELINYEMSTKYFNRLRKLQPSRVQDMEYYSTLLWHSNAKVEMTILVDFLLRNLPNEPQTWCCLGNYYSLANDHENAINAFKKASELNPNFAYAYTLEGHEHSANDSYGTAKICYRKAIACDAYHYNAYYGLGMCSMKLGQFDEALLFFEKARIINPVNVILICCCGIALEKLSYQEKALQYYELACELQPTSSFAKFKKSHLLFSMGRYSVALENFEELVVLTPDESAVHFILGQLYQMTGRKKDAIREFTIAINLDQKGNQVILDALEKCHMQE